MSRFPRLLTVLRPAGGRLPAASAALWVLAALALIVGREVALDPGRVLDAFSDTDDAMRLVQVRHLLAGQGWFDLSIPEVGAPEPLVSHWSRLVDAPLALIIAVAGLVVAPSTAEAVALYLWPPLLLGLLMLVVARHSAREAGPLAGAAALCLIAFSVPALFQFRTGRIDHHGMQVLGTVAGALFLLEAFERPGRGYVAGALLGLGVAVGLEPLYLVTAILALAALLAALDPAAIAGVGRAAVAFAAVLAAAFAATVPPSGWLELPCDTLGLNLVAFAAIGALAVGLALPRLERRSLAARLGALVAGGALALAAYGAIEPACLGGPFAKSDPRILPIWLDDVAETRSVLAFAESRPSLAAAYLASIGIALYAAYRRWRARPGSARLFGLGLVALAGAYGCIQVRLMPYGAWLAVPPTAVWIVTLSGTPLVPAGTLRLAALALACPLTLVVLAGAVVRLATGELPAAGPPAGEIDGCRRNSDHRRLAALAPGLVLADLNLGPFIVANSSHRVVAAPYHRIDASILAHHRIMRGTPEAAEAGLRALGVDYVVLCVASEPATVAGGFADMLRTGGEVEFLEPIAIAGLEPMKVWRVRPARRP